LPARPTEAGLADGAIYLTPKGPAIWNAKTKKFTVITR
jgi:hypothetical protein